MGPMGTMIKDKFDAEGRWLRVGGANTVTRDDRYGGGGMGRIGGRWNRTSKGCRSDMGRRNTRTWVDDHGRGHDAEGSGGSGEDWARWVD